MITHNERCTVPPSSETARLFRPEPSALSLPSARWLETVDVATAIAHLPCARWFLSVLVASELVDDLRSDGPWTVLVPTDAALARFGGGVLERLFDPEEAESLIDLGEHHVARGVVRLAPERPISVVTLGGAPVHVGASELDFSGAAAVLRANLQCRNGVVHLLEDVLAPASLEARFGGHRAGEGRSAA